MGQVNQGIDGRKFATLGKRLSRRRFAEGPPESATLQPTFSTASATTRRAGEKRQAVAARDCRRRQTDTDIAGSARDHQVKARHDRNECKPRTAILTMAATETLETLFMGAHSKGFCGQLARRFRPHVRWQAKINQVTR